MNMTRRGAIQGVMAGSVAFASGAQPSIQKAPDVARDHFWIFTVNAGMNDDRLGDGGVLGGSRMTPTEGAFFLGVANLIFVRENNSPPQPMHQKWRTKTSYEQFSIAFMPLKRVIWSVVGSGGAVQGDEVANILDLARKYRNITGVYLDDFFLSNGKSAKSIEQLKADRERLRIDGRRLESWLTLYTRELDPNHKDRRKLDLPIETYLDTFDVITMWTWNSDELVDLEANLGRLETAAPHSRKALGCYIWDFYNRKPVAIDAMKHQCDTGLRWMKQGKIQEMVFLANTVLDVGLEVADWTRAWIAHNGGIQVGGAQA
jgi:hypothetical protein